MSEKQGGFFDKKPMTGKQRLFKMLEDGDSGIKVAEFDTFPMTHNDVVRLEKIIRENTSVEVISLIDCNLSSEHLEILARAVLSNQTLQKFQVELFHDCSARVCNLMSLVQSHLMKNMSLIRRSASSEDEQLMKTICV